MDVRANNTSNGAVLLSDAVFEQIKERVGADEAKAKSINAVFAYKITKNGQVVKEWSNFFFIFHSELHFNCVCEFTYFQLWT